MALVVHEFGGLHKALIISGMAGFLACGGSALEGSGLDGAGDVEVGDGTQEVEGEVGDGTDATDSDLPDVVSDATDVPETTDGNDAGDIEVDVGPVDWEPVSFGDEGVIDDVVLVSDTLGFAASGSRVLRWDGRLWATYGEPGGSAGTVHGVWADPEWVVAVGANGLAYERFLVGGGGGLWQELPGAPAITLRAVVGRSSDDLFAAGDDGTVVHWDGATWTTRFTSATIDLNALWLRPGSVGDDGVFAVGTGGQLVSFVTPAGGGDKVWKAAQIAAGSVVLEDVIGLDDGTLVAVGDQHTITVKRPTASAWQGQVSNDERERDLAALAHDGGANAGANGGVRIFGASGAVLLSSGPSWNVDTTAGNVTGVKDFAVADSVVGGLVMALAGTGGGIQLAGTTWSSVATRPEATLTSFARRGDELWAVGTKGFLARRGPQGWTVVASGTDADLFAITALSDTVLVAVGAKGTILNIALEDGSDVVTKVPTPVPVDLYGVAPAASGVGAAAAGAIASGRGGTLMLIVADQATLLASGTTADLKAVQLGGDGRVWISGVFGTLLRMPAGEGGTFGVPEVIASGVGGALSAMAASSDGVFAVGDNGVILRANAATVVLENESPGAFLYAVATATSGAAVAAGSGGLVLVRSGATWTAEAVTERGATFDALYVSPDGAEALVGGAFRLMHVEARRLALEAL